MLSTEHVVVVVAVAACVYDLRTRRIPNGLTFGAALATVTFHGATGGTTGLMASAGGWLLGIALFFPFFALRGLGGGDVELLGAFGAWLGPVAVFHVGSISAHCRRRPSASWSRSTRGICCAALCAISKFLGTFWIDGRSSAGRRRDA